MTIQEWKVAHAVTEINLKQSKEGSKSKYYAEVASSRLGVLRVASSVKGFDLAKPIHVYPTEIANPDTGEITVVHILSNNSGAEVVATL